ncbi:MAG: hypothetical protein ABIU07_09610 [Ramlibacter sp.]
MVTTSGFPSDIEISVQRKGKAASRVSNRKSVSDVTQVPAWLAVAQAASRRVASARCVIVWRTRVPVPKLPFERVKDLRHQREIEMKARQISLGWCNEPESASLK